MEKAPEADRAFAKLAKRFVVLHFDTRNGKAPHVARLKVRRNQTYAIVLQPDGTEIARVEKPVDLKPVVVLMKKALKKQKSKRKSLSEPLAGYDRENPRKPAIAKN